MIRYLHARLIVVLRTIGWPLLMTCTVAMISARFRSVTVLIAPPCKSAISLGFSFMTQYSVTRTTSRVHHPPEDNSLIISEPRSDGTASE